MDQGADTGQAMDTDRGMDTDQGMDQATDPDTADTVPGTDTITVAATDLDTVLMDTDTASTAVTGSMGMQEDTMAEEASMGTEEAAAVAAVVVAVAVAAGAGTRLIILQVPPSLCSLPKRQSIVSIESTQSSREFTSSVRSVR